MLELINIHKTYTAGGVSTEVLKGISMKFRRNEFTSILGPSGCGKTTLLNIIGGLDQYTDGDLLIEGDLPPADGSLPAEDGLPAEDNSPSEGGT